MLTLKHVFTPPRKGRPMLFLATNHLLNITIEGLTQIYLERIDPAYEGRLSKANNQAFVSMPFGAR
jgi:hypothetical protein